MPVIELMKVSDLIPYARNARTHSDEQVRQLASSIKEFGFTNPVLVDKEGMIIAGHGRVMAAQKLGMDEVPTLEVGRDWSEAKVRAYILADNKLAINAGWDESLLTVELEELQAVNFDMDIVGFDAGELEELLAGNDDIQESEEPSSSAKEIDTDEFDMDHRCPKCGFEFDD